LTINCCRVAKSLQQLHETKTQENLIRVWENHSCCEVFPPAVKWDVPSTTDDFFWERLERDGVVVVPLPQNSRVNILREQGELVSLFSQIEEWEPVFQTFIQQWTFEGNSW
jgi:hypothetical protein